MNVPSAWRTTGGLTKGILQAYWFHRPCHFYHWFRDNSLQSWFPSGDRPEGKDTTKTERVQSLPFCFTLVLLHWGPFMYAAECSPTCWDCCSSVCFPDIIHGIATCCEASLVDFLTVSQCPDLCLRLSRFTIPLRSSEPPYSWPQIIM